jgi:hypothetical protein
MGLGCVETPRGEATQGRRSWRGALIFWISARPRRTRKCAPASVALIRASAGHLDGLKGRIRGGMQLRFFLLRRMAPPIPDKKEQTDVG